MKKIINEYAGQKNEFSLNMEYIYCQIIANGFCAILYFGEQNLKFIRKININKYKICNHKTHYSVIIDINMLKNNFTLLRSFMIRSKIELYNNNSKEFYNRIKNKSFFVYNNTNLLLKQNDLSSNLLLKLQKLANIELSLIKINNVFYYDITPNTIKDHIHITSLTVNYFNHQLNKNLI